MGHARAQGSPTFVALVATASSLPTVFLGVAGGALADLLDRRRLLLVTQILMLAAAAALAALDASGGLTPSSLLALTFALGVGAALNGPAWQAIQPELVPRDEFPQAVTLGGASINLGRALGPALGGFILTVAEPWLVFALNALSFGAVVVELWRWRREPDEAGGPAERFAGAVRAGIRYSLFSHALTGVLVRAGLFSLASAGLMALLPVYAKNVLGLGSGGLGLLLAGFGGGALIAAVLLPRVRARLGQDAVLAIAHSASPRPSWRWRSRAGRRLPWRSWWSPAAPGCCACRPSTWPPRRPCPAGCELAGLPCTSPSSPAGSPWQRRLGLSRRLAEDAGDLCLGGSCRSADAAAWLALAARCDQRPRSQPAPMYAPEMRLDR